MKNIILITIVGILAVSSIFMTIETATTGVEISELEKTESQLLSKKRDLEGSLVKTLSSTQLQEKSAELGFIKAAKLVYVTDLKPVAAKLP
jgi:cell division protein FtsL